MIYVCVFNAPVTRFRTLIDRILGMRMVYAQKSLNRQVSFEFLNRQMVWHAFTVSRIGYIYILSFYSSLVLGIPSLPCAIDQCRETEITLDAYASS